MKERKDFGRKPVRRSMSGEKKESPKVYRPRTLKLSGWGAKSEDKENPPEEDQPKERPSGRSKSREDQTTGSGKTSYRDREETRKGKSKRFDKDFDYEESPRKRRGRDMRDKGGYGKSRLKGTERGVSGKSRDERPKGRRTAYTESDDRFASKRNVSGKESGKRMARNESGFEQHQEYGRKGRYGKEYKSSRFEKAPETPGYGKKNVKKPPHIDWELETDKDGYIRLNKYIANSGLCSRREADEFIEKGFITVNGITVSELGSKVKLSDEIRFKGKELDPEKKVYILLNKPKDYITTVDDPNAKRTVMDLIQGACSQRVYPVGRLDRNSTGLLLLTNDGELTKRLTHPSFMKKKVYEVGLDRSLKPEDMETIAKGVKIDDEVVRPDAIAYADPKDASVIGIEIHSGQNRIVRRIFESIGYKVQKLDRVYYAGFTKKNLPRGKWRFLNQKEVNMLKMNRFE